MQASNTPQDQSAVAAKPARRWLKTAAWTAAGLVTLAVGTTGALWWWAGTEGSLAKALRWVGQSQPLTFEQATGSLRAGGHIDQLHWQQDGITVDARDVSLAWQAWSLLQGTLKLDRLAAASVEVTDMRPPTLTPTIPPNALGLPLRIALDEFSVGQFQLAGKTAFTASAITGSYLYTGLQHQLDLKSVNIAKGRYSGRAALTATGPLTLDASLSGTLDAAIPNSPALVPLTFQATAKGPVTELLVKAELQVIPPAAGEKQPFKQPQASATARVMPWAAQPLPQADATFRDLDIAALFPDLPQTLLTGSASVRPLETSAPGAPSSALQAWALQLKLVNALPGPWDQQRLPLEQLDTQGEWRNGAAMVRSLKAQLAGGELLASGQWTQPPPAGESAATIPATTPEPAWKVNATLKRINPAQLHTQLAPLPLDGKAEASGQGANLRFDASVQTVSGTNAAGSRPAPRTHSGENNFLQQLRLRDAKATGTWNAQQAGGTLALSALQVRTDDAELKGKIEVQPKEKAGQGALDLTAPGLSARFNGALRPTSGDGELQLRAGDAAQALRWLQKLPGMPEAALNASASGNAGLQARWQGGWQNPAVQASLEVPSLDWIAATPKAVAQAKVTPSTPIAPVATAATSPSLLKIRELRATLSGRLSQAQLQAQGRVEIDQRRYALQMAGDGGRVQTAGNANARLNEVPWQAVVRQLSLSVEDPGLGAGAWRLATRGPLPLRWTPTRNGGAFESGAGEALLTAPATNASSAVPSQATLSWQPVRWRSGELVTAGKITGLPIAWVELLAGPQMKGAGLGGSLVFNGQWDAVLGNTLQLKASLARSSGDITVQAEGVQGNSARVAAGIK
ncbi:MAG: DUF490 domain-containing protein, partial [Polaromonas sp.]